MTSLYSTVLAGLFVLLAGSASAQSEDMKAMAQQFGQSAKQNAMALRMYAWQMRVEITLKGDPKPAKLFAMRVDPDGVVQKTALNAAPPAQPTRGLKGRIKEKKVAEFKEWAGDLVDAVQRLSRPVTRVAPGVLREGAHRTGPRRLCSALRRRGDFPR